MIVVLFALWLRTACAKQPTRQLVRIKTVEVGVPTLVALPDELTRPCVVPAFPPSLTVGALQDLTVVLYASLDLCSQEKAQIRDLQPLVE